jgi:hypothetical protein
VLQREYAASAWAVMCRMGNILVFDELNGNDVHRLENVMTMEMGIHGLFDELGLWLEATVGHHLAMARIYLIPGYNIRTCPTNIRYAQPIPSFSLVFPRPSLSLRETIFRYQTCTI